MANPARSPFPWSTVYADPLAVREECQVTIAQVENAGRLNPVSLGPLVIGLDDARPTPMPNQGVRQARTKAFTVGD
jgi:hypothetical protein